MAFPVYKELVSARQSINGLDDPKTAQALEDLGYAYSKTDNTKKADVVFKQAMTIREKEAKKDPAALTACIKRYADFLRSTNRKDEAAKLEAKISAPTSTAKAPPAAPAGKTTPGKTASK
jgi:hypothetical protein